MRKFVSPLIILGFLAHSAYAEETLNGCVTLKNDQNKVSFYYAFRDEESQTPIFYAKLAPQSLGDNVSIAAVSQLADPLKPIPQTHPRMYSPSKNHQWLYIVISKTLQAIDESVRVLPVIRNANGELIDLSSKDKRNVSNYIDALPPENDQGHSKVVFENSDTRICEHKLFN